MNRTRLVLMILQSFIVHFTFAQNYPTFGPEKKVTINGLTIDAMEPFITADGSTLFFNSLNSGGNTNLFYATKTNDTTFTYSGLVNGTYDASPNHLDGVASADSAGNFFWTSLRGYPAKMENLHKGIYAAGSVSNIKRVYGSLNRYSFSYPFGWIIMDAAISHQGNLLYFCNAKFDFSNTSCVGVPCESKIGVAQKLNDSTFNKLLSSDAVFSRINDTLNYLVYAPQITKDGRELYYTRLLKNSVNTEICVSVRNNLADTFSLPSVIHTKPGFVPEAASPTSDKQRIYYHQKDSAGVYRIYTRNRTYTTGMGEFSGYLNASVYPNPANKTINVVLPGPPENYTVTIYSPGGDEIFIEKNNSSVDIASFPSGMYFLRVSQHGRNWMTKFLKE